ncbi:hypothetical protein SSPIM334S_02809 [Streptomyces spiroverticillatus]
MPPPRPLPERNAPRLRPGRTTQLLTLTAVAALALTGTALAESGAGVAVRGGTNDNWGSVLQTDETVQADTWSVRAKGEAGTLVEGDTRSHFPAFDGAPTTTDQRGKAVQLQYNGQPMGLLIEPFTETRKLKGTGKGDNGGDGVRARTLIETIDLGMPYTAHDGPGGGAAKAELGLKLDKVKVVAEALPGKPVHFDTSVGSGALYAKGKALITVDPKKNPRSWAPNAGIRFPMDPKVAPRLIVTVNEQITTDGQGYPTMDDDGSYRFDPKALSGYANAVHLTVLTPDIADITIGHAAALHAPGPNE